MADTGTGAGPSPDAVARQAARELAERRRAEARSRFDTPSWLGPSLHPDRDSAPAIPDQPEPPHEDLVPEEPVPGGERVPAEAHWTEKPRPRLVAGLLLAVSMAGTGVALVYTVTTQSVPAIVALVLGALISVLCRGAMMSSGLVSTHLKGAQLKVHHDGYVDTFDLAGPVQLVELVGTPGDHDWRVRLQTVDGRIVELHDGQVDAGELHRVVAYYRAVADRRRAQDRRDRS